MIDPGLRTSSQIPQNSKSGFLFPSLAGFLSQLSCFMCFCELTKVEFGHLPCIFHLSLTFPPYLLLFPLRFFLTGHSSFSSHTHPHSLHVSFTLIRKKTVTESKCHDWWWCLQEMKQVQEHSALNSRKTSLWRECFSAAVRIQVLGRLLLPLGWER